MQRVHKLYGIQVGSERIPQLCHSHPSVLLGVGKGGNRKKQETEHQSSHKDSFPKVGCGSEAELLIVPNFQLTMEYG
jgi:hypothetical protein